MTETAIKKTQRQRFISGVVIVTPGHLHHLNTALGDLLGQTLKFDEILVVASGFKPKNRHELERQIRRLDASKVKMIFVPPGSAGRNRNLALREVSSNTELVFFSDADDRYSTRRNEVVYKEFKQKKFDALIHSFVPTTPDSIGLVVDVLESHVHKGENRIGSEELFETNFPAGKRARREEELGLVNPSLILPKRCLGRSLHHAHVVVDPLGIGETRFHEKFFPRNEDSLFVRDLLFDGKKVVGILEPLSVWVLGTSSFSAAGVGPKLFWKLERLCYRGLASLRWRTQIFSKRLPNNEIRHTKKKVTENPFP